MKVEPEGYTEREQGVNGQMTWNHSSRESGPEVPRAKVHIFFSARRKCYTFST